MVSVLPSRIFAQLGHHLPRRYTMCPPRRRIARPDHATGSLGEGLNSFQNTEMIYIYIYMYICIYVYIYKYIYTTELHEILLHY